MSELGAASEQHADQAREARRLYSLPCPGRRVPELAGCGLAGAMGEGEDVWMSRRRRTMRTEKGSQIRDWDIRAHHRLRVSGKSISPAADGKGQP
jgi:hypothetical protein